MQQNRTASEELAFRAAELDAAMTEAGFKLAFSDPDAARDISFRARYIRSRSTFHPQLQAYIEYYSAARSYSLKISTTDELMSATYGFIVKNHTGSLKELLEQYFSEARRGKPLKAEDVKK